MANRFELLLGDKVGGFAQSTPSGVGPLPGVEAAQRGVEVAKDVGRAIAADVPIIRSIARIEAGKPVTEEMKDIVLGRTPELQARSVQIATEREQIRQDFLSQGVSEEDAGRRSRIAMTPTQRKELDDMVMGFTMGAPGVVGKKAADTALSRLINAIKGAKPARKELAALQSAERAKRVGAASEALRVARGEKAFIQAKGELKGELVPEEKIPRFEALQAEAPATGKVVKQDVEELTRMIQETPYLTTFEKISTFDGLNDILQGRIPQPKKISLLEQVFGSDLTEAIMKQRPFFEKATGFIKNIFGTSKAIMSSFDLSFGGRQGIFAAPRFRKEFWDSWKKQFGAFGSEKAAQKIAKEVADNSDYLLARDSGLSFTKLGNLISEREERFASAWGDKIPIVKQSARAYNAFANKFRMDIFHSMINDLRAMGVSEEIIKEKAKGIAAYVNMITGRGPLGKAESIADWLNVALFSPRLLTSRLSLLNPVLYVSGDPFIRKQALSTLLHFGTYVVTTLTLAKMAGLEVGTDCTSADFGKIKSGNTRIDITGGFVQYARITCQLISGKYTSTVTGKQVTLGEGYKPITRFDILLRQIESKEAPIFSFITDLLKQQTPEGKPVDISDEIIERITPIVLSDLNDLRKYNPDLLPFGLIGLFGVGVQTYKSRKKANRFSL